MRAKISVLSGVVVGSCAVAVFRALTKQVLPVTFPYGNDTVRSCQHHLMDSFSLFRRQTLCLLPTCLLSLISPALASQPSAPSPLPAPLRNLQWGQLNFLHTTDTHGWLAGHLLEYGIV